MFWLRQMSLGQSPAPRCRIIANIRVVHQTRLISPLMARGGRITFVLQVTLHSGPGKLPTFPTSEPPNTLIDFQSHLLHQLMSRAPGCHNWKICNDTSFLLWGVSVASAEMTQKQQCKLKFTIRSSKCKFLAISLFQC